MADIGFPKKERCEAVVDVENRMPSMAIKIKCAALTQHLGSFSEKYVLGKRRRRSK